MVKTGSERQAELRSKRKEKGLKRLELWVFDEDRECITKYADYLTDTRLKNKNTKK